MNDFRIALRQQFPVEYARKEAVRVDALHEALVGDFRQSMLLLLAAVIVVLATALANLVSLALVRANGRRAELSMRIAIGASRLHLTRQLTVEALLLAVIGSVIGWVVGAQAIRVALPLAPASIPRLCEVSLDGTVALFVIAVTAVVAALLTVAPLGALASTRAADALRGASRGAIGDRWNCRVRNVMVVAEISAALVLLLTTIVLVQNLRQLQDLHPGFNPDGVFQARPDAAISGTGTMRQFLEDSLGPRRFNLGLFGAFASTAVLLALVGLYGHSGGGHSGAPHWSRADGRLAARAPRGPDRTDAGAQGTVTPLVSACPRSFGEPELLPPAPRSRGSCRATARHRPRRRH